VATVQTPTTYLDEILDLIASLPTEDELLNYRPSQHVQDRARELLLNQNEGKLGPDEEEELDQFTEAEMFMQLLTARIHARRAKKA
jgi:hypothetical protein